MSAAVVSLQQAINKNAPAKEPSPSELHSGGPEDVLADEVAVPGRGIVEEGGVPALANYTVKLRDFLRHSRESDRNDSCR